MKTTYERFWSKVSVTPSCWLWTAGTSPSGYGVFSEGGRDKRAHRFSYETEVGPIPDGLELDHLCRVRECVNPGHLEPVTHKENMRRGEGGKHESDKTHCLRGHEFSMANTYNRKDRKCRICRTCARLRNYEQRRKSI